MQNPAHIDASLAQQIATDGYAIIRQVLDHSHVSRLIHALAELPDDQIAVRQRPRRGTFARRNLLTIPQIRDLAISPALLVPVTEVLGGSPFPVRSILFDKTPNANWVVPWHQDLSIAVEEQIETPGYGPWSTKAGVPHVQPPVKVLRAMLTLRLHLDDCGADNGPLRVVPGSHQAIHSADELSHQAAGSTVSCLALAGDALLMRPLIVHASSPATLPGNRRVIHIEYATQPLPGRLKWKFG